MRTGLMTAGLDDTAPGRARRQLPGRSHSARHVSYDDGRKIWNGPSTGVPP
jgi:hypothetical protein